MHAHLSTRSGQTTVDVIDNEFAQMCLQRNRHAPPDRQTDSQTARSGLAQWTKPSSPKQQLYQLHHHQPKLQTINTADLVPSPRRNRPSPEKLNFQFSNFTPWQSEDTPGYPQDVSALPHNFPERSSNPHNPGNVESNQNPATETKPSNPHPTFDTHYQYKPSASTLTMTPPASTVQSSGDKPTPQAAASSVSTTVTACFSLNTSNTCCVSPRDHRGCVLHYLRI